MVISKRKKFLKRIIDSLSEKTQLSTNKGIFIRTPNRKPNRKERRHSGRKYPYCSYPNWLLEENGIILDWYWDDWVDYRDGFRDCRDKNKLRKQGRSYWMEREEVIRWNDKIKKQIKIRKAKKKRISSCS